MIVGNGDIAKALKKSVLVEALDSEYIFFASGVSNSLEAREEEYQREHRLLLDQDNLKHIVYFSSLSVLYSNTRYAIHKRQMENVISSYFKSYTIIRLGNITWGNNPHTLINFIRNKIKNNESFDVEDTYRYIIDKDEFLHWINMIPDWNCEMNITGNRMKVSDIITKYGYIDVHTQ